MEEGQDTVDLDSSEAISGFRNRLSIKVKGREVPAPVPEFRKMPFHPSVKGQLLRQIEESRWKEPTPIQMQAIPALLQSRDVLAAAPTGSGKTAAFALPLLSKLAASGSSDGVKALVLAPTRELADQIYRELTRLAEGRRVKMCLLKRSLIAAATTKQEKAFLAKFEVVVSTPMRLLYVLRHELIDLSQVMTIILDEVDKLFEVDGETQETEETSEDTSRSSFLVQSDEILAACTNENIQRCLFSATIGPLVLELAQSFLRDPVHITIGKANATAETIEQKLVFVGREEGKLLGIRQLIQEGLKPPVLIFVQSKERAKALLKELVYDGINVDSIHAERTQQQREKVIEGFRKGEIWVLICTDLMARGVDFKAVQMVVNYDLPSTAVSYVHRIGRTGRAGMRGKAVTFFTEADVPRLRSIANVMKLSGCDIPDWMLSIKPMTTKERRRLRRNAPDRRNISTEAKYDLLKRKKRKLIIRQSKEKKLRIQASNGAEI